MSDIYIIYYMHIKIDLYHSYHMRRGFTYISFLKIKKCLYNQHSAEDKVVQNNAT